MAVGLALLAATWLLAGARPCAAEPAADLDRPRPVQVVLHDGAVLTGELLGSREGRLWIALPDGRVVQVALEDVATFGAPQEEPALPRPPPAPPEPTPDPAYFAAPLDEPAVEGSTLPIAEAPPRPPSRPERFDLGVDLAPVPGFGLGIGARGVVLLDRAAPRGLGLRVGVAHSSLHWETDQWGMRFMPGEPHPVVWYLAGVATAGSARGEVQATLGWSAFPGDPGWWGAAGGLAGRARVGASPVLVQAGLLVLSDLCWCRPVLAIDLGPSLSW